MDNLLLPIVAAIAVLTIFLTVTAALKYMMPNRFTRTRLIMTLFFCFIVVTLTMSFWQYALVSLWFTVPAALVGVLVGWAVGVRAAKERLMLQGAEDYVEHFAHIHLADIKHLKWWSLINFYSVVGALLLINFVGLSTVIFKGNKPVALGACVFGAFLLGTLVPYLAHLWTISAKR